MRRPKTAWEIRASLRLTRSYHYQSNFWEKEVMTGQTIARRWRQPWRMWRKDRSRVGSWYIKPDDKGGLCTYSTNTVYIIAYFLHISCILLAYNMPYICIFKTYNCIFSAYLSIFLAYFMHIFAYLTNIVYIIAYLVVHITAYLSRKMAYNMHI